MVELIQQTWKRADVVALALLYWKVGGAGALILFGILFGVLLGRVWPGMATQLWPWPLAMILLGLGLLVRQNVLVAFGLILATLGVGVLLI